MKIELKNIKYAAFASQETACYSASLYIDGRKIGTVSNDGHGGCDYFHAADPVKASHIQYELANDWCVANLPKWNMSEYGDDCVQDVNTECDTDLEMHCATLLNDHLAAKDLRAAMRKSVLFILPGETAIQALGFKRTPKVTDAHIDHVAAKYTPEAILNRLPFDEALALYRERA